MVCEASERPDYATLAEMQVVSSPSSVSFISNYLHQLDAVDRLDILPWLKDPSA